MLKTILRRAFMLNNKRAATPPFTLKLTDPDENAALKAWNLMHSLNAFNDGFELVDQHLKLSPFMLEPRYWKGKSRPSLVTIIREPWARHISAWRYKEKACAENQTWISRASCDVLFAKGFEADTLNLCGKGRHESWPGCSLQFAYMTPSPRLTEEEVLNGYNLVLINEQFDISLMVMHFDIGVPLAALPHFAWNQNNCSSKVEYSDETKSAALAEGLAKDVTLYNIAVDKLLRRANELRISTGGLFDSVLNRLQKANKLAKRKCGFKPQRCSNKVRHKLSVTAQEQAEISIYNCLNQIWNMEPLEV